jgi:predicted NAD/FAD-dependent oxidoreductase
MGALAAHIARDVDVRCRVRVSSVVEVGGAGDPDRWRLIDDAGEALGEFGAVVVAVPPAQAVPLLAGAPGLAAAVGELRVAPCWALMVSFEAPLPTDFDGAFIEGEEGEARDQAGGSGPAVQPLAWVARNGSKPGRPEGPGAEGSREDSWVLHAGPEWSRAHLSLGPEGAGAALLEAFDARFGPLPPVRFQRAHLWRYARPLDRTGPAALFDAERGIGVCGDALAGGRVEGALLSGRAVAGRLLGQAPSTASNPLGEGVGATEGEPREDQLGLEL